MLQLRSTGIRPASDAVIISRGFDRSGRMVSVIDESIRSTAELVVVGKKMAIKDVTLFSFLHSFALSQLRNTEHLQSASNGSIP